MTRNNQNHKNTSPVNEAMSYEQELIMSASKYPPNGYSRPTGHIEYAALRYAVGR